MDDKNYNRRKFLSQLGLTLGAGAVSTSFTIPFADKINDECKETPILELGPYAVMKYRKQADHDIDLTQINGHSEVAVGQIITVFGKITDKNCNPIHSAIVEIWQANHYGKYHHEYDKSEYKDDPNFQGWGQAITNEQGEYKFKTIYPAPYGGRTRHIHFKVSRRDYHELTTQMFFEGEERNKKDSILNIFTHEEQQLLIRPLIDKDNAKQVEFNLVLDEVKKNSLPEKVLKEYTGNYSLKNTPFDMKGFMKGTMGIEVNNFDLKITQKREQLFMTLSFYPMVEMVWTSKDEFQSWSFSNTYVRFLRDEKGKVVGLRLHFDEVNYVEATKKNNR
ncbi:MAG: intradiol ring-cleavage dioxygenase [Chryseobacterium sp.]|nr:MAG: intradiol ring-cleavage dioxygenase [Chryseobacterium sp.]